MSSSITIHSVLHKPFQLDLTEMDITDVPTLKIMIMSLKEDLTSEYSNLLLIGEKSSSAVSNASTSTSNIPLKSRRLLSDSDPLDDSITDIMVLHPIHSSKKRYMTPPEIQAVVQAQEKKQNELTQKDKNAGNAMNQDFNNLMQVLAQGLGGMGGGNAR